MTLKELALITFIISSGNMPESAFKTIRPFEVTFFTLRIARKTSTLY